MFSAVRQGASIYVLDKDNLVLKVGSIVSTTQPTYGNQWLPNVSAIPIDIVVKYDDGTTNEFKQVQPNASIANYGGVVVAETNELMLQEVEQMMRNSKAQIDNLPYHQKVLEMGRDMMAVLSPAYAKEQQTDKEIATLKNDIGEIKDILVKLSSSVSKQKTS